MIPADPNDALRLRETCLHLAVSGHSYYPPSEMRAPTTAEITERAKQFYEFVTETSKP